MPVRDYARVAGPVEKIIFFLIVQLRARKVEAVYFDPVTQYSDTHVRKSTRYPIYNPLARTRKLAVVAELAFAVSFVPHLVRLNLAEDYRIVHVNLNYQVLAIHSLRRILRLNLRIVYTTHNHDLYVTFGNGQRTPLRARFVERLAVRWADSVTAPTRSVALGVNKLRPLPKSRTIVVPAGVEIEEISRHIRTWPLPSDEGLLVCPARIEPRKNQLGLVKAINILNQKGSKLRLALVGPCQDQKYQAEVMRFVDEHKLPVKFTGQLPRRQFFDYYQRASVIVFPTFSEAQGLVVLEAMAFGTPVITSRIDPIMDLISGQDECALLVDPSNPDAIASAIDRLLHNRELMNRLVANAHALVEKKYRWSRMASRFVEVYDKLAQT